MKPFSKTYYLNLPKVEKVSVSFVHSKVISDYNKKFLHEKSNFNQLRLSELLSFGSCCIIEFIIKINEEQFRFSGKKIIKSFNF